MADAVAYLLLFGMVVAPPLYTLEMAQLSKDEAGCFQDCLDRHGSRKQRNCCGLSR